MTLQTSLIRITWNLRKVNNVNPRWYKQCGTYCSSCGLAYDFDDSLKALLLSWAKNQIRGPRCIICSRILRTRSKPIPKSGFWDKIKEIEKN